MSSLTFAHVIYNSETMCSCLVTECAYLHVMSWIDRTCACTAPRQCNGAPKEIYKSPCSPHTQSSSCLHTVLFKGGFHKRFHPPPVVKGTTTTTKQNATNRCSKGLHTSTAQTKTSVWVPDQTANFALTYPPKQHGSPCNIVFQKHRASKRGLTSMSRGLKWAP